VNLPKPLTLDTVSLTNTNSFNFSAEAKRILRTNTPAKSNRYHKGLYHMKTHGKKYQRCFSMKQSIATQRPNVKSKTLFSDILGQKFKIELSMKARKCIMKAGSLDKYLLNTIPKKIDSNFGLLLRDHIQKK
jgi:ribosomal protein L28